MNTVSQRTVNARNVYAMQKKNVDVVLVLKQIVTTNIASQTADVVVLNVLVLKLLAVYALIYKASSFLLVILLI